MGNCCEKKEKIRYLYLINRTWTLSDYDNGSDPFIICKVCQKRITAQYVIAKCIYCRTIIGHGSCISPDQSCLVCSY